MQTELSLISSMATRTVLAETTQAWTAAGNGVVRVESVGGVDAARRVMDGEAFDVVMLASGAIDKLIAAGRAQPGSRVDIVRSGIAVAVRAGAARPPIGDEAALRDAVLAARSLSFSTGPSGAHLMSLFERWGIAGRIADRLVQAPPGVPVGTLVADGRVELGFQQLSEMMNLPGIQVLGPLPPSAQAMTIFSAAICTACHQVPAARALLEYLVSPATDETIRRHGMEPARQA